MFLAVEVVLAIERGTLTPECCHEGGEFVAAVVLVHGIWNRQKGVSAERAAELLADAARPRLEQGLGSARLSHLMVPEMAMAYYADLLSDAGEVQSGGAARLEELSPQELAEVWQWLLTAGVPEPEEAQAGWLAPVRQGLGWLVRRHGGNQMEPRDRRGLMDRLERLICGLVTEVNSYLSRPPVRAAARERVAAAIRAECPGVVVAHSLGSLVAYETLHAYPELEIELLVTLGSPLGLPLLVRNLEPGLREGRAARPAGVRRWVNIADAGDLVALPPKLGGLFPVDAHETTDIGLFDAHTLGGYLAAGLTAVAIAPYLSE
ncbi:hypothetical protein [Streptomyces virginiae]|uniref:hypothetical protein n=1 Tax=Streptomyces virginiae TaxID=1961 RepID=UPI0032475687